MFASGRTRQHLSRRLRAFTAPRPGTDGTAAVGEFRVQGPSVRSLGDVCRSGARLALAIPAICEEVALPSSCARWAGAWKTTLAARQSWSWGLRQGGARLGDSRATTRCWRSGGGNVTSMEATETEELCGHVLGIIGAYGLSVSSTAGSCTRRPDPPPRRLSPSPSPTGATPGAASYHVLLGDPPHRRREAAKCSARSAATACSSRIRPRVIAERLERRSERR